VSFISRRLRGLSQRYFAINCGLFEDKIKKYFGRVIKEIEKLLRN